MRLHTPSLLKSYLFTTFEQTTELRMQLPVQRPLPIRQGMQQKGVVVIKESRSRNEQHDAKYSGYGMQRA